MAARVPKSCKVYTPEKLARAMVRALLPRNPGGTWLEPSFGRGVFLRCLSEAGVPSHRVIAVDLDKAPSDYDELATCIRGVDFLAKPTLPINRFDFVVGNPPYLAIRSLASKQRATASGVLDNAGRAVGVRANTWYAFLQRSIQYLDDGGSIAFILPAASEYADYCKPGRSGVTSLFDRVDLIRSRSPLFESVREGSVVLVCRGKGGGGGLYSRHEVSDLNEAVSTLGTLDATKASRCKVAFQRHALETRRLGEIATIQLGGVTGDAGYFILTEDRRKQLRLPESCLTRVVSRSRDIRSAAITEAGWSELRRKGRRVWLFRPTHAQSSDKAIASYLKLDAESGGCHRERFKIKNRTPWYRTPLPKRPDAFISGMNQAGVWMCMNEFPELNATNTLYVASFRRRLTRAERYAWALSLLSSSAAVQLRACVRKYADGLGKIEPGQLARIQIPVPPALRNSVSVYKRAIALLMSGEEGACRELADSYVSGEKPGRI